MKNDGYSTTMQEDYIYQYRTVSKTEANWIEITLGVTLSLVMIALALNLLKVLFWV